jgi:hypothetical protein
MSDLSVSPEIELRKAGDSSASVSRPVMGLTPSFPCLFLSHFS